MHAQLDTRAGWIDRAIFALAARQHGVVARAQLHALGIGRGAIAHRLQTGRLFIVHRAVYAVGHPALTREGKWIAALLAAGPGAALSHASAAQLWALSLPAPETVHVTIPKGRAPGRGITIHRNHLCDDEVTSRAGLRVTTVSRTLLDLAGVATRAGLARAFREAEAKRLINAATLDEALSRRPGRRGNKHLRAALANAGYGTGRTRSELEARFTAFLRRHRLRPPARNLQLRIGPLDIEADCVWVQERVIVELDSRAFHDTDTAFESDRARDRALAVHGWTVIRVTWRQLERDELQLAQDLDVLLRRDRG